MKKNFFIVFFSITFFYGFPIDFNSFFFHKTLRLDFIHSGNSKNEKMTIIDMKELPFWGGSTINLIDTWNYGNNFVQVFDSASGKLIFSRGFNSLFKEWQRLPEAKQKSLAFYEVVEIPYPKATVKVKFFSRNFKTWQLEQKSEYYISPNYYMIKHDDKYSNFKYELLWGDSTDYQNRLDIVFLAEGYSASSMSKFRNDIEKMYKFLFEYEPFKSYTNKINIWAVYSVSAENGVDDPRKGIYRKSCLNSSFNTFGSDRYLTTTDLRNVYDFASLVPHDQVYILVNTDKYGGGGIYNFFSLTSVDHKLSRLVFVHEFGHALAGLADEYYYDEEEYADYYPDSLEPWEPNITTLVNFESKWKSMVADSVPVPTPDIPKYYKIVGAFEGGGYRSKGVYRPMHTCIMKELSAPGFCPVCQKALENRIKFIIGE
jgi:hypothetical protein